MSRWIDAEWLKRQILIPNSLLLKVIDSAPSIDIVRCRECKYKEFCEKKIHRHGIAYSIDFCSYGERKGE